MGPGILLLSPALKLMHMNRQTWELSRKITQAEDGKAATGVLLTAVTEVCAEIVTAFQPRTNAKDWEQVQITRLVGTPNPPQVPVITGLRPGVSYLSVASKRGGVQKNAVRKERQPATRRGPITTATLKS